RDRPPGPHHHPSAPARIRTLNARELERQAMLTVAALAATGGALLEAPRRGARETYARLGQQARLQVEARRGPPPPFEPLPLEAERGLARLPAPSAGDVFLDF